MDRNPNDLSTSPTGNPGSSGNYGTAGTTGNTGQLGTAGGAPMPSRSADMPLGSASGGTSDDMTRRASAGAYDSAEGTADRMRSDARERMEEAREQLGEAAQKARGWKESMEQGLADRLQAGASKLRERAQAMPSTSDSMADTMAGTAGTPAYAGAAAGTASGTSRAMADRAKSMEQNVARGMDATADWLRNGDLQSTVEQQARSNPARTLLVALGVGYILGKTLRR